MIVRGESTIIDYHAPFDQGLINKQLVHKKVVPVVTWNIVKYSQSSKRARLKFISECFESKLNSDNNDEKEMILKQTSDVLVPRYIGKINFAFHFLKQIQRADWGSTVFGSWVDVISNRCPRLPKTRSCNTSSATLRGHRKSRIQAKSKIFAPKCFE